MFRIVLTVLIIATTALPAFAQQPRFFIERIEVRNAHHASPDLVISETLLREGSEYSEEELAAAAARLTRLPFLVSADFALEKGSDRGKHVLVITVAETKPFFFLIDAVPVLKEGEGPSRVDYADDDLGSESKDAALGFRWFVGRRGILHFGVLNRNAQHAFISGYSAVSAGYTQYDILGTRAFATVSVRLPYGRLAEDTISPQVVVGIPLTTSQTLTLDYEDTHFHRDTQMIAGVETPRQDAQRVVSLSWTYNTTNHPFAPTSGTIVRVTPLRSMRDRARWTQRIPDGVQPVAQHINGYGIDLLASRYWELSELNAVSAGVLGGWSRVDDEETFRPDFHWEPAYQALRAGYSRSLTHGDTNRGDSRLELEGRFVARQSNFEREHGFGLDEDKVLQGTVSWVRRSTWGTLRVGAGYAWDY